MPRQCTVCAHAEKENINAQLVAGVSFDTLAGTYGLTKAALHRHYTNGHIPTQLVKAKDARKWPPLMG